VALISSGPARVLDTGSVTAFRGHPLTLQTTLSDVVFGVTFTFASDASVADVAVEPSTSGHDLTLRCVNFDSAEGRGSSEPVLLGECGPDLLFFHFRVFKYGRTHDRTVAYTFYAVDKETIGWQTA